MNSFSVTGKKWVYKKYSSDDVTFIKDNFFLDEATAKLLAIKNIKREDIKNFLNPSLKNILPNPNTLLDMDKATNRVLKSIIQKDKIGIFGDYDVDGATSTALLGKYFNEINQTYEIYIPDRKTEGYGPSIKGFNYLIENGSKIIFTVDCGTLSFDPIKHAKKKGIDILIFDHHQSEIKMPEAYSIVNPNRIDDSSNLNYLCAVGVCFMFLISLNKSLRKINWFKQNNIKEPNLIAFLDLVSLGTVCDVVPLIGVNRAIVKQGLKILNSKKNLGLKTLLDICKIESKPTPYHLGYIIGPRINAGGRVGKCSHGSRLLLDDNPKNSFQLASELEMYNKERQLLEKDLINIVLEKSKENLSDPVLVLSGDKWHEGIIGIVASRIKEKYNKPTIIISISNEIGKASARSTTNFDIGSMIISAVQEGILIKGGGHKMAGGFTITETKIEEFKNYIFKKYKKLNLLSSEQKKVFIDSEIGPSALNNDFYSKIENLSPFGSGNAEPKFAIFNLKILNSKIVGEKHIKSILIGKDGTTLKTIAFNSVDTNLSAYLIKKNNKALNIVGKLSLNEWRGQKNVEFIIDDISVNNEHKFTVPSSIG